MKLRICASCMVPVESNKQFCPRCGQTDKVREVGQREFIKLLNDKGEREHGPLLRTGLIARVMDTDVEFLAALAAGDRRATDQCSEFIGGLRVGHVEELQRLGFFAALSEKTELEIGVGSWQAIPPGKLHDLIGVIDDVCPRPSPRDLLVAIPEMAQTAETEGSSIVFL